MAGPAPTPLGFSFTLDQEAAQEVQEASQAAGVSPDKLIGIALRLVLMTLDAERKNRRVLVTSDSGYPIKEIVIPREWR